MAGPSAEGFGVLLRRLRSAAGLTQEELAGAAGVSSRSVSDLERGVTLTARKETARLLAGALDLTGPDRATFEAAARGRCPAGGLAVGRAAATRTLPRDIASFTGREPQLRRLLQVAAGWGAAGGVHVIVGMPGVGKTALAVHAAHLLADRFADRQLFIDLHAHTPGREPMSAHWALAELLTAIGVDPGCLPESLEGRAGLWRDRMAGQRALLVLDNAAATGQVAPLLPGGGSCLVLVTSRRYLGDLPGVVVPVLLEALPAGQAREMFLRLAPRAAESDGALELAGLAGNLPLAISLLARVHARHRSWTLADLARETRASLLTLVAEKDSIAAAFEVSYRYLAPGRQRFFCCLSLHPGATIDAHAAAALAGVPLREAGAHLDALHGECLLTEPGCRRYGMHDLIRRYARDRAAADHPADRDQALHRLLDYYQGAAARADSHLACRPSARTAPPALATLPTTLPDLPDDARALAWVRTEGTNILACLDHANQTGQHARVVALTAIMATLLRQHGPWRDVIALHNTAAQAARHLGDRQGEAGALNDLGDAMFLNGNFQGAAEAQEKSLAIYRDLGHQAGQANALVELGGLRELTGDRRGADDLQEALSIYRSLGDWLGQAWALNWVGYSRRLCGDRSDAEEPLAAALSICREIGHREGQACALNQIGVVRRQVGNFSGAAESLAESLSIYRDLGHRQGQASALSQLGVVRRETGDYKDAAAALAEAVSICRDLGFRQGEAEALNESGTLHRVCGDQGQAEKCHQAALELARQTGNSWDEAQALAGLGRCALAAGDSAGATDGLRKAQEIFHRIGTAEAATVAAELDALAGPGSSLESGC